MIINGTNFGSDSSKIAIITRNITCEKVVVMYPHFAVSCTIHIATSGILDVQVGVDGQTSQYFYYNYTVPTLDTQLNTPDSD